MDAKAVVHLSVPKKTVKKATHRNRLKRLLREAVRRADGFAPGVTYRLRVERLPKEETLEETLRAVASLL